MKACIYPSTIGVPHLAMIGPSTATKSTMAYQTIPKELQEILNIVGPTSGQHTLIPSHFFGNEDHKGSTVKLQITLKDTFDSDALFNAIDYNLRNFVSRSSSAGIPLTILKNYVSDSKFVETLLTEVSGAIRLEKLRSEMFCDLVKSCVLSLLESFDTSEVDAAIAKMKTDKEQNEAKLLSFSNQMRVRWDLELKTEDSPTSRFVSHIKVEVLFKLWQAVPHECKSDHHVTCEVDLQNDMDKEGLKSLFNPYEPFSLIVEQYEIAHGLSNQLLNVIKAKKEAGIWPNKDLPFRMVVMDTPGLTQDSNVSEYTMKMRLKTALNRDIDGILIMLPTTSFDGTTHAIQRLFSNQSDEGRQIRKNKVQLHVAITRADEKVTPTSDVEYDEINFIKNMNDIYESLKRLEISAAQNFMAESARCVTNHYKKTTAYIEDLISIEQEELAEKFKALLGNQSALNYLVYIVSKMQEQIFSSYDEQIFFKSVAPQVDNQHFNINLISANIAKQVSNEMAVYSKSYQFDQWLYWSTAYAFRDSVHAGLRFVSRAIVHGKINVYIDGDFQKTINIDWATEACRFTIRNVDFSDERSVTLLRALGLSQNPVEEEYLHNALQKFFLQNFTGNSIWRFNRAMSRAVRRLSYREPSIKSRIDEAFKIGWETDASAGVQCMLQKYKEIYQSQDFYKDVIEVMNDELTKEFNKLFYVIYN